MVITEEIRQALRDAKNHYRTQMELSRITGISSSLLARYVKGSVKSIDDLNWSRLSPLLRKFNPSLTEGVKMGESLLSAPASVVDGRPLSDEEIVMLRMLRDLPASERTQSRHELSDRYIRFSLAAKRTA